MPRGDAEPQLSIRMLGKEFAERGFDLFAADDPLAARSNELALRRPASRQIFRVAVAKALLQRRDRLTNFAFHGGVVALFRRKGDETRERNEQGGQQDDVAWHKFFSNEKTAARRRPKIFVA